MLYVLNDIYYKCEVFFISIAVAYITYATVYIEAGRIFQL